MTSKAAEKQKIERYARSLLDAGRTEGRAARDVQQIRHALKFSPEVLSFLSRVEQDDESPIIEEVYSDLKELLDNEDATVTVDVTTAVPMDTNLRAKVYHKCREDFEAPVFLVEHVEPSILGGIIIEARGHRRDASVRAQLMNIRKTLSSSFMGGDAR